MIRIPKAFYWDHESRDLPTPVVIKQTKRHFWISENDDSISELLSDARHYADGSNGWDESVRGVCASARATVRAIEEVLGA